jgi:hypothetical protein
MRPFKPVRRVIPFSVFRNMKPNELKAIGAKVLPPLYLTPSDVKPKPSEAAVYYQLHEATSEELAVAPPKRVLGFREWCKGSYEPRTEINESKLSKEARNKIVHDGKQQKSFFLKRDDHFSSDLETVRSRRSE